MVATTSCSFLYILQDNWLLHGWTYYFLFWIIFSYQHLDNRVHIMRCISTGVPSNQNQEVLPQYSSQESHSWFRGGYAKRFPPLSHPLPDLELPPYLPYHVECYPTMITTLPNGLKIASENSLVCRCNFFFFSHGPWILCFQDIFYCIAVSSLINGFSIVQFSVWNSSFFYVWLNLTDGRALLLA